MWPLAAFGGAGFRTALLLSLASVLAAAAMRPQIGQGSRRTADLALVALIALMLLQLVPLPAALARLLSPHASDVRTALALAPDGARAGAALSIERSDTAWAALVTAASIAIFWMARCLFDRGGVRLVLRAICTTGLAVSVLAIAQAATAGRHIYWMFPTDHEGPLPFGPFVNRNHFATWAIMAAPLCFGYIAARRDRQTGASAPLAAWRVRLARLVDGRTLWLFACGTALVGAVLLSLSRSGMVALGAAAALAVLVARRRSDASGYWWFVAAAGAAAAGAVLWADMAAIGDRLAGTATAIEGRVRIWRETLPIVRDFWLTGTGAGTYQTAMLLYQQSDRLWYFNQAHNHYLQLAAEGGLLLTAPVAVAAAAFVREAARRVRDDTSGMFWVRAGALCGLGAVALQSLWETGVTMPANAALAAVLAALAVHHRPTASRG